MLRCALACSRSPATAPGARSRPPTRATAARTAVSDTKPPTDACRSITDQFDSCMYGSGADVTITDDGTYDTDTGMLVVGSGVAIQIDDQHISTPAGMIDLIAT